MNRRSLVSLILTGGVACLISLLVMAAYFAANLASLGRDLPAAKASIRTAFVQTELGDHDYLRGDTRIGHHQFNDCLILMQSVDQRASKTELMVSPTNPQYANSQGNCLDLKRLVNGEVPPQEQGFYHRYLHGHTMLARYLLPNMQVATIRTVYKSAIVLTLFAGIALAMVSLVQGRRVQESLFWLIFFMAFSRFFGVEAFGQSLGHAPPDFIFLFTALFLAIWSLTCGISGRTAIVLSVVFGCLTLIFEFLTGGIALGMALILGGLPFALRSKQPNMLITDTAHAFVAYCTAIVTGIALRIVVIHQVFGMEPITSTAHKLSIRMGIQNGEEELDMGAYMFLRSILRGLDGIVPGTRLLSMLTLLVAVLAGFWGYRVLVRSGDAVMAVRARLVLVSNIAIILILLAFWQHTIIHAWFMDRTLCWTIATGFGLFALALVGRNAFTPTPQLGLAT